MKTLPFKYVLIGMLLVTAAAAELFLYKAYAEPRRQAALELGRLTQMLRQESKRVEPRAQNLPDGGSSIPLLLGRVQDVAGANGVLVRSLAPQPEAKDRFLIDVGGSYPDIVRFLSDFEALNVSIGAFQIERPDKDDQEEGLIRATFRFARTEAQSRGRLAYAELFRAGLTSAHIRNPFGADSESQASLAANDLTWSHHLSSISQIGDARAATVDGETHMVGDEVLGLTLKRIGPDSVTLTDTNGAEFLVRFRSLPGKRL
jgi:hypothetical protein